MARFWRVSRTRILPQSPGVTRHVYAVVSRCCAVVGEGKTGLLHCSRPSEDSDIADAPRPPPAHIKLPKFWSDMLVPGASRWRVFAYSTSERLVGDDSRGGMRAFGDLKVSAETSER